MILNKFSTLMIRAAVNNTDFNSTTSFLNDNSVVTDYTGYFIGGTTAFCIVALLLFGYSKYSHYYMMRKVLRATQNVPTEPARPIQSGPILFNHDNEDTTTLNAIIDSVIDNV